MAGGPGRYELLAGASSADVRQRTVLTLDGEPGVPARSSNAAWTRRTSTSRAAPRSSTGPGSRATR
ncbi:hypothetical protein ACR6C2_33155 [Streptomyces sp. INA 01156]